MNPSYPIGTLAEKIVAVTFRLDGTITPLVRTRRADGRVVPADHADLVPGRRTGPTEFVARVAKGHSGIAKIKIDIWEWYYTHGMIPLGPVNAFADRELGERFVSGAGADPERAGTHPEEVWFRFEGGRLTWRSDAISGEAVVNATYPQISVVLQLPPGNEGEIAFASPIFTTASGELASVLSVA